MADTELKVFNNGPIQLEGDFQIKDQKGNDYNMHGRNKVFLCRCGLSSTKPFCDGSHKEGFEHKAEAFELPKTP